jgi:hypothetical protein
VVRPSITLAYSTLWRPNGRGLHSTPFKWSNDQLEYHGVFLSYTFSRSRGISTTWSLSPLHLMITKKHISKGGESNTHKTQSESTIMHTSHNLSSKHNARSSLLKWSSSHYSNNRMRENGVLVLWNDQRMLVLLLHAPRGPFYSPKAARSRWWQSGKTILAFYQVAHRTVRCTTGQALFMVRCRLPSWNGIADHCRIVAVGAPDTVGAHRTVRCLLPTVGAGHVSPADLAADRCTRGHWLTGQSGAAPDSPVQHWTVRWIIAVRRRRIPESGQFAKSQPGAPDTVRCTTGHYPVHHRTVRCVRLRWVLAALAKSFPFSLFSDSST